MFPRALRGRADQGQALPVYITVIGALLFLAFAYFAVGQAAATRNGAQTAADSAALAATQDRGAQIRGALLRVLQSGGPGGAGGVGALLGGVFPGLLDSCGKAQDFANDNKASVDSCQAVAGGYSVSVVTDYTVGKSVLPGTENKRAHASATAVMTPLCSWQANPDSPSPTPSGASPTPTATPGPGAASPGTLRCRGGSWTVDPAHPGDFPSVADLFSVHLTS